ncbi:MAG TPA: SPOR domain-containing protein [Candidatus Acidoferrum sp.]|nr:SPOR domain-containing protein [Candidatus Acidoferrum sp.]
MIRPRNISKLALIALLALLLQSCGGLVQHGKEEVSSKPATAPEDQRHFDPLDLPGDTVIVPSLDDKVTPSTQAFAQHHREPSSPADTLYNQVFRVQLVTCETYGEGRIALRTAEEIFDQPVYMDYDVPYFKVRVGDFKTRAEAEAYQRKAVTAGYGNAWVVPVTVTVQQPSPMYENLPATPPSDSSRPGK